VPGPIDVIRLDIIRGATWPSGPPSAGTAALAVARATGAAAARADFSPASAGGGFGPGSTIHSREWRTS
jgi:hypothetical protein